MVVVENFPGVRDETQDILVGLGGGAERGRSDRPSK
jgi:hypothetical protein